MSVRPARRSSTTRIRTASCSWRNRTRLDPMKPHPPVISTESMTGRVPYVRNEGEAGYIIIRPANGRGEP